MTAPRPAWARSLAFAAGTVSVLVLLLVGLAQGASMTLAEAWRYGLGYMNETEYMRPGVLANAAMFLRTAPAAVLGRFGLVLYVPLALGLWWVARNGPALWKEPFFRFLVLYLTAAVAFFTQWDPTNVEHKIALLPPLILLFVYTHARGALPLAGWARRAAVCGVAGLVLAGLLLGVLPFTDLESYELYRLSSAIRETSRGDEVLLVGLSTREAGHPVVMASQTFFGQRIRLSHPGEQQFEQTVDSYRRRGLDVLRYDRGAVQAY